VPWRVKLSEVLGRVFAANAPTALTLDTGDTEENLYLHTRCWNDWQQRRRGEDEYEAGYAHGLRDARS